MVEIAILKSLEKRGLITKSEYQYAVQLLKEEERKKAS